MNEPLRLLIDVNVWLDVYLAERPGHSDALALMDACEAHGLTLLYGASKLETVFYLVNAAVKQAARHDTGTLTQGDVLAARAYAWGCSENMQNLATAVGMDGSDLWLATKYRSVVDDLEDAVVLAAAKRSQADYLITCDAVLLRQAGAVLRAVTPQVMVTILREGL